MLFSQPASGLSLKDLDLRLTRIVTTVSRPRVHLHVQLQARSRLEHWRLLEEESTARSSNCFSVPQSCS